MLAGDGATAATADLPAVRYASVASRQLHALARDLPLAAGAGVYQALGEEKVRIEARAVADILAVGFDGIKPASVIFEHSAQGPFAQLAITHGLTGPFHILEAGELSGALALVAAVTDLERGRCPQALVGGFTLEPARAWLLLLAPGTGVRVRWSFARAAAAPPAPDDPLGLGALAAALRAPPAALAFATPDGRGVRIEIEPQD